MPNDLVPAPESALERFTKSLNLPEMIAGPAGRAISRLVAGVVEIPAAYLDDFAQSIKNKTKAREIVNTEVAQAAAKLVAEDTDIVARAAHNLLAKEYRRQKNKEDIARRTLELLEAAPAQEQGEKPDYVDDDWINIFERYAEDASSDRMKDLWARVLPGQIRRPKSFSLQTLRFIAELDERTAHLFQVIASRVKNGDFIPYAETEGQVFSELLALEEAGLISGVGGTLAKIFNNIKPDRPITFRVVTCVTTTFRAKSSVVIILFKDEAQRVTVQGVFLTRIGREIYNVIDIIDSKELDQLLADKFPKNGVAKIVRYVTTATPDGRQSAPEDLWSVPEQQPIATQTTP